MDLGSRLANLSLAEIASMLNTKQQEVLLASISVAARFIQQLQAEEQLQQQQQQQLQQQEQDELDRQQQEQEQQLLILSQHQRQQQPQQPHDNNSNSSSPDNNHLQQQQQQRQLKSTSLNNSGSRSRHQQSLTNNTTRLSSLVDDEDNNDDDDDDDDVINDQSSDISFDDYSYGDQSSLGHHHNNSISNNHNRHHHHNHHHSSAHLLSADDGQTLLTIREFADELKARRKAIRLSQKGAAQSLRAFTSGDQPCTDAIIYHFENLQLEPDRAMQLIPLLTNWLEWAEKHRFNGKQLPMQSAVTKVPRERKRKVVLFNEKAKQNLEDAFLKNNHPDRYQLDVISQELNIPTRSIRKWFTNRRQRKRFAEKFSPVS